MSRKIAGEGWPVSRLGERLARPRWRGTRLTAARHTRDADSSQYPRGQLGAFGLGYRTSATVVAFTPRERFMLAPSRAAERGSALQIQS
jgi:hypothetical protein